VVDPGSDGRLGSADDGQTLTAYGLTAEALAAAPVNLTTNLPDSDSDYYTWEITATKRPSTTWSLLASFTKTWSYEAAVAPGNDFTPNALINATDSQDRFTTWQAKLNAAVMLPLDFRLVPVVRSQSGTPFARTFVRTLNYGNAVIKTEPIAANRTPNVTLVDLRTEKGFGIGRARVMGFFDVYNVFNTNAEQTVTTSSGASWLRPTAITGPSHRAGGHPTGMVGFVTPMMRQSRRRSAVILFIAMIMVGVAVPAASDSSTAILLLHSTGHDGPGRFPFDTAFARTVRELSDVKVDLYIETLDLNRFAGEAHARRTREYLREKYAGKTITVVAVVWGRGPGVSARRARPVVPHGADCRRAARAPAIAARARRRHLGRQRGRRDRRPRAEAAPAGAADRRDRWFRPRGQRRRCAERRSEKPNQNPGVTRSRCCPPRRATRRTAAPRQGDASGRDYLARPTIHRPARRTHRTPERRA
jgi:hypothetical protein